MKIVFTKLLIFLAIMSSGQNVDDITEKFHFEYRHLSELGYKQNIDLTELKTNKYHTTAESRSIANQLVYNNSCLQLFLELDWHGEGHTFNLVLEELLYKIGNYDPNFKLTNIQISWEFEKINFVKFDYLNETHHIELHPYSSREKLKSVDNIKNILTAINNTAYKNCVNNSLALITCHTKYGFGITSIPNSVIQKLEGIIQIENNITKYKTDFKIQAWGDAYPQLNEINDLKDVGYFWGDDREIMFQQFVQYYSKPEESISITICLNEKRKTLINSGSILYKPNNRNENISYIEFNYKNQILKYQYMDNNIYLVYLMNIIADQFGFDRNIYIGYRGPDLCQRYELEAGTIMYVANSIEYKNLKKNLYCNENHPKKDDQISLGTSDFIKKYQLK